jgi:hypothetical protein
MLKLNLCKTKAVNLYFLTNKLKCWLPLDINNSKYIGVVCRDYYNQLTCIQLYKWYLTTPISCGRFGALKSDKTQVMLTAYLWSHLWFTLNIDKNWACNHYREWERFVIRFRNELQTLMGSFHCPKLRMSQ